MEHDNEETVALDFDRVVHRTTSAVLFDTGEPEGLWVPNSIIRDLDEDAREVTVPVWWVRNKGLV